nr:MAG TPA: hypothetical protein [Caudoviricetes sp.]
MTAKNEIIKTIFNKDFNIINNLFELQAVPMTDSDSIDIILEEAREKNNLYNAYYHHNDLFLEELLLDLININDSYLIELFNYEIIRLLQYNLNILYNAYKTFDNIESLYAFFDDDKTIIKELQQDNLLFILDDIIILVDDTAPNKIYHC